MAIVLALTAALIWGASDFAAGLAARRLPVLVVLALVETGGLVVILVIAIVGGSPFFDHPRDAALAVGAGLSGMLGLGCLFRAMAIGTVSVIAPISSAGVALPVVVGVATGDRLSLTAAVGLVVIVTGVVLASREQHENAAARRASRLSIGFALLAAAGFGGFFAMSDPPADVSVAWTLVLARAAVLPFIFVVFAVRRPARLPSRRLALGLTAIGLLDLLATGLLAIANTRGEVSIVSVVGSMYPVMTILLAALVLHERLLALQRAGVVLALAGVALVALG